MRSITILLFLFTMFFTVASYAQKRPGNAMQWKIVAQLPSQNNQARANGLAGPAAGIDGGALLIAGGANFPDSMPWLGGRKKYYDDTYVFEQKEHVLALTPESYKLPFAIAYSATCTTGQGILIAGGENESGISKKVLLLSWDKSHQQVRTTNLPDLPVAVTNAAAASVGNKIFIAGGETMSGVSNQFLVLDLDDTIARWKTLPSLPQYMSHTVLTVQRNGQDLAIYAAGGRKKNDNGISELYSSMFEFDLGKHEWIVKKSLPYALSAGTAIAVGQNEIWLFGGDRGETFHKTEKVIAAIKNETNDETREVLNKEKICLQSSHPGFSKEILKYDTVKDEWKGMDSIPFETPVTTTAVLWENDVLIPSGEIRAGVRTPLIWAGKFNTAR